MAKAPDVGAPFPSGQMDLPLEQVKAATKGLSTAEKNAVYRGLTRLKRGLSIGDDTIKALSKTKIGKGILMGAGVATGVGVMAASESVEPETKEGVWDYLKYMYPQVELGKKIWEKGARGVGEAFGERAREIGGLVRGGVEGGAEIGSELLTGAMGPTYFADQPVEDEAAQLAQALQQTGGGPAAEEPTPSGAPAAEPGGITGTGTKDDPYTMVGQLSEREQAYQEMRGDPGFINAKHHGDMAQAEVTKLLTLLQNHGHRMDPQVKQNTLQQLQFQSKIAGQWQARVREREKEVEDILKTGEMARQARVKEEHKQGLQTDRLLSGIEAREKAKYRTIRLGNAANVMRDLYKAWLTDKKASNRQRVEEQLFDMVEQIYEDQGRQKPSPEEITQTVRNLVFLNDETMFVMGVESLLK
jgi:hypothetical protein